MAAASRVHKGNSKRVARSSRKSAKPRKFKVAPGVLRAIRAEWLNSTDKDLSKTSLAKKYGVCRDTIRDIVEAKEVKEIAEAMEQTLLITTADRVTERIEYEVGTKKSKAGAWIAMDLAERWGAIPPKVRSGFRGAFDSRQPIDVKPLSEEERVSDIVRKCTEIVMERGKIFGMPLPEIEEVVKDEVTIPLHEKEQAE